MFLLLCAANMPTTTWSMVCSISNHCLYGSSLSAIGGFCPSWFTDPTSHAPNTGLEIFNSLSLLVEVALLLILNCMQLNSAIFSYNTFIFSFFLFFFFFSFFVVKISILILCISSSQLSQKSSSINNFPLFFILELHVIP